MQTDRHSTREKLFGGNQNPEQYVASCISRVNVCVVHLLFSKQTQNEWSPFAFYCNLFRYYWLFSFILLLLTFLRVFTGEKMMRCSVFMSQISGWPLFPDNATQKKGDSIFNTGYQVLLVFRISRCLPITALFSHCCLLQCGFAPFFLCRLHSELDFRSVKKWSTLKPAATLVWQARKDRQNTLRISHIYCRLWAFMRIIIQRFESWFRNACVCVYDVLCVWKMCSYR